MFQVLNIRKLELRILRLKDDERLGHFKEKNFIQTYLIKKVEDLKVISFLNTQKLHFRNFVVENKADRKLTILTFGTKVKWVYW